MTAQKLVPIYADVFDEETKVFASGLGLQWFDSFGDVNYNLINSEQMCEKQGIVVLQKSVEHNPSYSMKLTLGDFGVINQSSKKRERLLRFGLMDYFNTYCWAIKKCKRSRHT